MFPVISFELGSGACPESVMGLIYFRFTRLLEAYSLGR